MHAPRREPFWPDEPRWLQASDPAKRIALVRRYALVLPGLVAVIAISAMWATGVDPVAFWRDVPVVTASSHSQIPNRHPAIGTNGGMLTNH
jgi:hypothetical protein